jgi:hypothetical protein
MGDVHTADYITKIKSLPNVHFLLFAKRWMDDCYFCSVRIIADSIKVILMMSKTQRKLR